MSYTDGWAALNLEMPARIPRTEYSADMHWDLVRTVTGMDVNLHSAPEVRSAAVKAFMHAWEYDFLWNTLIGDEDLGAWHTDMGHAEYAMEGSDRRDTIYSPFSTPEQVLAFDPLAQLPKLDPTALRKRFEAHYQASCANYGDAVNMSGVYISVVSGLLSLFGWDNLLMAAGIDLKGFGALTNRYAMWAQQYFNALAESDVPVVMIHDDLVWSSGAIFRPAWYREFIFPNLKKYIDPLRQAGKKVMFTSDGDYTKFIDDIAAAGVNGFIMEPMTSLELLAERYGKTHVLIGNADTRILLSGTREQIRAEVERCMNVGRNCPGFFMAVGNHIPPNTPVENCLYYNEVYQELSRR